MTFLNINGQKLAVYDSGGALPVVLFSHGVFMNHSVWDQQVDALRGRYRTVTWDERAHGATVTDGKPFSYWDSAADALGILDELGVAQAVLVGHSQGGFINVRAALQAPGRIVGLVNISTHGHALEPEVVEGFTQLEAAWLEYGADAVSPGLAEMLIGDSNASLRWIPEWQAADASNVTMALATLRAADDMGERPSAISAPVCQIHGSADPAIPVEVARQLYDLFPNGRGFDIVQGAGHTPGLTHAAEVNAAIERFLAGLA